MQRLPQKEAITDTLDQNGPNLQDIITHNKVTISIMLKKVKDLKL